MINLDEELFEHLRTPESVEYLAKEGFDSDLAFDIDLRSIANWTFDYYKKFGNAPTEESFLYEWGDADDPFPSPKTSLDVGYLLEQLRDRLIQLRRREIVEKLVDQTDSAEFTDTLVKESYKLWRATSSQRHVLTLEDYDDLIGKFIKDAENHEQGASYGFVSLDSITGGGKAGHLSFLAARPKRYKTWIGLKAFVEQRRQGLTPVFFNLELSAEEAYQRLVCLATGTSFTNMKRGLTTPSEWKRIQESMGEFADLGPAYIITPPYDQRRVDDLILETQRLQANSVIIDQLSYLQECCR